MYHAARDIDGERRKEPRFAAHIDGILSWDGMSQSVIIRNISAYGALISGAYLPVLGDRVTLIADHLEVCGTVIWRSQERCGILLTSEVDPYALLADEGGIEMVGHGLPPVVTLGRVGPGVYI